MLTYCQICRSEIPREREAKNANTCGDPCAAILSGHKRSRRAEKKCRLCSRRISLAQLLSMQAIEALEFYSTAFDSNVHPEWIASRVPEQIAADSGEMAKSVLASIQAFRDKQRSRATSKTNRRSTAGVLMEHNEVSESVRPTDAVKGVNSEFSTSVVSAALTSERQESNSVTALVAERGKVENSIPLCNSEAFTQARTLENEVESLLTVGAELPVESRPQADTPGNSQLYSHSVEKRAL